MMKPVLRSFAVIAAALCIASSEPVAAGQATPAQRAKPGGATAKAGSARTVTLEGIDAMKFVPASIQAKPGERLRVVLKTTTTLPKIAMAHNFVLLKAGVDVPSFITASMQARATDYVPASRKADVLASTGLAGKGETVEVTFTAPKTPGTYTFVCTFPGHFAGGMKGTLVVK